MYKRKTAAYRKLAYHGSIVRNGLFSFSPHHQQLDGNPDDDGRTGEMTESRRSQRTVDNHLSSCIPAKSCMITRFVSFVPNFQVAKKNLLVE